MYKIGVAGVGRETGGHRKRTSFDLIFELSHLPQSKFLWNSLICGYKMQTPYEAFCYLTSQSSQEIFNQRIKLNFVYKDGKFL